jgi:hypothetical protein
MIVASEAEKLTDRVKRHRDGLASAINRLLKRSKGLTSGERRTLLKTLQSSRQQFETLEKALAGDGGGPTLTN